MRSPRWNRHGRTLVCVACLCLLLASHGSGLAHPADPAAESAAHPPSSPSGAPEAPESKIRPDTAGSVKLFWSHLVENNAYLVQRSEIPYFQPGDAGANAIVSINADGYGAGSIIEYVEDGVDRYPADGTVAPPVQVVGDVEHNYFWAVEGWAGIGSGFLNWVGEFDYALVKGN